MVTEHTKPKIIWSIPLPFHPDMTNLVCLTILGDATHEAHDPGGQGGYHRLKAAKVQLNQENKPLRANIRHYHN
jgi:hypothetical protein